MIKLTDILSKPVISLSDSKTEGIIKSAVFDKNFKRLKFLILFDNEELTTEKALSVSEIYSLGENAIIIKDGHSLELELSCVKIDDKNLPINNFVYTYLGKCLGQVLDIILDEKYNIVSILVKDKTIDRADIISSGLDAVIVQDKEKKVKTSSLKRKKQKSVKGLGVKSTNQKVYILEEDTNQDENIILGEETYNLNVPKIESIQVEGQESEQTLKKPKVIYELTDNPEAPKNYTTNYEFLLGRKLTKNIYSPTRELIAKKNTRITKEIIQKSQVFYKVREIIKYSH